MWAELMKNLKAYPSAVLTGLDLEGFPFSVRCIPQPDPVEKILLVQLPPLAPIQPGPAGLLCHSHDEQLWSLAVAWYDNRLSPDARRPKPAEMRTIFARVNPGFLVARDNVACFNYCAANRVLSCAEN